jgi:hypothetical protein
MRRDGFLFNATLFGDGARGMAVQAYRCVEQPRITIIATRESSDAQFVEKWYIDNDREFDTLAAALEALKMTPEPVENPT